MLFPIKLKKKFPDEKFFQERSEIVKDKEKEFLETLAATGWSKQTKTTGGKGFLHGKLGVSFRKHSIGFNATMSALIRQNEYKVAMLFLNEEMGSVGIWFFRTDGIKDSYLLSKGSSEEAGMHITAAVFMGNDKLQGLLKKVTDEGRDTVFVLQPDKSARDFFTTDIR